MRRTFTHFCWLAAVCTGLLAACSPKLDWREMPIADGRARVLFPAKPVTVTRETNLGGKGYSMTLTAARVGNAQFAAGTISVVPGQEPQAAQAWAKSMLANAQVNAQPVPARVNNALGALDAVGNGSMNGAAARLYARFAWRSGQVFAAIAVGTNEELAEAHAKQFATSLMLP